MRATQPVTVAGIEFDALISEDRGFEASIPQYAVEEGYSVSDAIILGAESLSMTLYVTDTPVTWLNRHGSARGRSEQVCDQLESLYYSHSPVTVVTSEKVYESMGIESMSISKSAEIGYAREVSISFKKIRKTTAKTTSIPASYGKSGTTGASAGTASTKSGSGQASDTKGIGATILYGIGKSILK